MLLSTKYVPKVQIGLNEDRERKKRKMAGWGGGLRGKEENKQKETVANVRCL